MGKTEQKLVIYHNESCSKSACAINMVKEKGIEFELVPYLEEVPSIAALQSIVQKLRCKPHDLIRTNEVVYKEKFEGQQLTDEQWIMAMHQYPILIHRPILVSGDQASIGRSTEAVQAML